MITDIEFHEDSFNKQVDMTFEKVKLLENKFSKDIEDFNEKFIFACLLNDIKYVKENITNITKSNKDLISAAVCCYHQKRIEILKILLTNENIKKDFILNHPEKIKAIEKDLLGLKIQEF